MQINGCSGLQ